MAAQALVVAEVEMVLVLVEVVVPLLLLVVVVLVVCGAGGGLFRRSSIWFLWSSILSILFWLSSILFRRSTRALFRRPAGDWSCQAY